MSFSSIYVPGVPIAQPRHRATSIGGKARMYLPTKHPVSAWKQQIALSWSNRRLPKFDGPLWFDVVFLMPRPKSRTKKRVPNERYEHVSKPDLDNLVKAVCDALNGVAWCDDSQLCKVSAEKWVCGDADQVGAVIRVREASRGT